MNKFYLMAFLCLVVFSLNQCTQNQVAKPAPVQSEVFQTVAPTFGEYDTQLKYGAHLVTILGCNDCHTPKIMGQFGPIADTTRTLSGHPAQSPKLNIDVAEIQSKGYALTDDLTRWVGPWGTSFAANLTPDVTGIANWTIENFKLALREGKFKGLPNGRTLLPPMPWAETTRFLSDSEIEAVFAFVKSIKPISNNVPAALPPAEVKATKGNKK